MWSEVLPNGKVRYVERYEHPLTGKSCKISIVMDKDNKTNRKLAQISLQDKISQKIDSLMSSTKKDNLTLSDLVGLYLIYLESAVKKSTYTRNKTAAFSMMRILGKEVLVEKLTAAYVKNQLALEREKPGRTNERIKRFKAMIRWGYENEYISDIRWLDKLKPLKDEEKKKKLEEKFLESREVSLLLNSIQIEKWRLLAEFMVLSGLRCGEAISLNDSDIDFKKRIIYVTKTYDYRHKIVTSPKTEDSDREVFMQDELYALCKKIRTFMAKERMLAGYRSKLFMSDINGDFLGYDAFNKHLKIVSHQTLGYSITTHYLRHTHVALLAEQGISLDAISRRLGHSDSNITKHIYFHVTEKLKEKENAEIKNVKIL